MGSYKWTFISSFSPNAWFTEWFKHFWGPHICSNLKHGSVGKLQDAHYHCAKMLRADLHIIHTHHVETHGVLRLLCSPPFLPSSSSFGLSHRLSLSFSNAKHAHMFFCCPEQLCCNQRRVSKKVMYDWEAWSGPVYGANSTGAVMAGCQRTSTLQNVHLCTL